MGITRQDTLKMAEVLGYTIPEKDVDDYTTLLERTRQAFEDLSAMEDYQPTPDYSQTPRTNIHLPTPKVNPLNAWAWRCECKHLAPPSTTLQGKTLSLKDNIALAQVPCLLGTDSLQGTWVPVVDATVASRVLEAGGTVLGKGTCENLSRGAVSATAATGPVGNPFASGFNVGGSSSGTAVLVARGDVDLGVGCDQGGSIRIPAAMAGLYGMKATFGLVPYTGIASMDASLDYVGPMTRTCLDCALLLGVLAGADGLDDRQGAETPFPAQVPDYVTELKATENTGVKGMRIGILKEGVEYPGMDAELKAKFAAAAEVFERLGAVVEEVSVPMHSRQARAIYTVSSKMGNHMGMLGRATGRRQVMMTDLYERKNLPYTQDALSKMSAFSREGLLSGTYGWAEHGCAYPKAVNLGRKLKDQYDAALTNFDVLILPTTLSPPRPLPPPDASVLDHVDAGRGMMENTAPFNVTGHPALAMPIGFVQAAAADSGVRVPASMQIVGRHWGEGVVFRVAYAWEREVDWRTF